MSTAISPLAPASFPEMPPVAGVRLATAAAGIRYPGRTDVLLALFDAGTTMSGVFTRSKCPSAAVDWCRDRIKGGGASALVVNSGNANAFTGKSGAAATKLTAEIAANAARRVPRFDRRHRRTARCDEVRRCHGSPRCRRRVRRLA
jgi:glutamate N-acetyltransferase/amino-acid N-acetyltransferase